MANKRKPNNRSQNNRRYDNSNTANKRDQQNRKKRLEDDLSHERDAGKYQQTEEKLRAMNDISWYTKYPELAAAASNIPFPYKPGMTLPVATLGSIKIGDDIPGVMGIHYYPSVGFSEDVTSPVSQAAKELFKAVRASFSGSIEADAPDFIMYLMALDSIYSYIGYLQRLYKVLDMYTPTNYQLPDGLLRAMGFTQSAILGLRRDKVTLWQNINTLIRMTDKFSCPDVMDIFRRHYWMNSNVYLDAPSSSTLNTQMYVFVPEGFYEFSDTSETGGRLDIVPLTVSTATAATLFNYGLELIAALSNSDDAYIISGYLKRAFEGTPSFSVALQMQMEELMPVYSEEVNMQIENLRPVYSGENFDDSTLAITQDPNTNAVISKPVLTLTTPPSTTLTINPVVNVHKDVVSPADVIIATRLQTNYELNPDTTDTFNVICGTELVTHVQHVSVVNDVVTATTMPFIQMWDVTGQIQGPVVRGWTNILSIWSKYDWAPFMYRFITKGSTTEPQYEMQVIGDYYNVTVMSQEQLRQINRVCVFSEFSAFNIK